jgi:nitric oxide dioxygenase
MTTAQKSLITATVPILKEHGLLLTTHFYKRMFEHNPELKNIFNMGNQESSRQPTALAMAVLAYAENIANPMVLLPAVDRIGHKHASLNIRPEQYAIVGNHLIASIQEVLGEGATAEIVDAWTAAYSELAQLMSGHEANLYAKQVEKEHGWSGWRPFKVVKKVKESDEITSFYLSPAEGSNVPLHKPGQYLSIKLFIDELGFYQTRQYSISSAPNKEYYRISVKREKGTNIDEQGLISNQLHLSVQENDVVDISAPAGNFILPENADSPVMFLSGGVGLTPFISMLSDLVNNKHQQPITWIHGCRSKEVHAFKDELDGLNKKSANFSQHTFYENAATEDLENGIQQGYMDLNQLKTVQHHENTQYYLCGPSGFIKKQHQDLVAAGVDKEAIHFEEFGPAVLVV